MADSVPANPAFELDQLVAGEENVLALSGAMKVIEKPGGQFNPLFIHGSPSVGKTHLLYSIRNELEKRHPDWNILALPACEFVEECDAAWQNRTAIEFRQQIWRLQVFLIDDVHQLVNRPAAQEELYHAFNRFLADDKQLVFTSRFAPPELGDLPITLRSRFQSGLVVRIDSPRDALLRSILEQRCQLLGLRPTREATSFLCREIRNARDLDGVVNHLSQTHPHNGRPARLTLADVRGVVEQFASEQLSIPEVTKVVCKYFNVDVTRVRSACRQQQLVQARQLAMYFAREITNASLVEIGKFFGGRDHTTVLYACRKVAEDIRENAFFARAAHEVQALLREPG